MTEITRIPLLADGALLLDVDPSCLDATRGWIPRFPPGSIKALEDRARAVILVRPGRGIPPSPPAEKPLLRLFSVSAWPDGASTVRIHGDAAGVQGTIDLQGREAKITVPSDALEALNGELFTALTITSAFLLGRLGRTLIHAAAALDPEGACWLLIGDTHSGKTTTTINLVRGGWGFLSDDHVVGWPGSHAPKIEGWPRHFHVDEGWREGRVVGRRAAVDPGEFDTGRWLREAPLGGLLFPQVRADEPTGLQPLNGATALSLLIRQTPWLLADPGAAGDLLTLLTDIASFPAYLLSVGRDSYADSEVLLRQFAAR